MDEVGFVNDELFMVFQPLLSILGSWMFIASSPPTDPNHWFNQLEKSDPKGYQSFNFEKICKKCQSEGNIIGKVTKCPHIKLMNSVMKDNRATDDLMLGLNISAEKNWRELAGLTVQDNSCAFRDDEIEKIFDSNNDIRDMSSIKSIYVGIDPAGNGSNKTVCTGVTRINGLLTVLWIDYDDVTDRDIYRFILNSIYEVSKKFRKTNKIPIIIAMESNGNNDGETLYNFIQAQEGVHFENVHVITDHSREKGKGLHGVVTSRDKKIAMLNLLIARVEDKTIRFHENFGTNAKGGIDDVKKETRRQFTTYRGMDWSLKLNGKKRKSGENSGKSGLLNDDIVLAIMLVLYWMRQFERNDIYARQKSCVTYDV